MQLLTTLSLSESLTLIHYGTSSTYIAQPLTNSTLSHQRFPVPVLFRKTVLKCRYLLDCLDLPSNKRNAYCLLGCCDRHWATRGPLLPPASKLLYFHAISVYYPFYLKFIWEPPRARSCNVRQYLTWKMSQRHHNLLGNGSEEDTDEDDCSLNSRVVESTSPFSIFIWMSNSMWPEQFMRPLSQNMLKPFIPHLSK